MRTLAKIATALSFLLFSVGLTLGSTLPAHASVTANWHSQERVNPFTGQETHIWARPDSSVVFYEMQLDLNPDYCAEEVTPDVGSTMVIEPCTGADYQLFAFFAYPGAGANYYQIEDEASGNCIDDGSGGVDIRATMSDCSDLYSVWYDYCYESQYQGIGPVTDGYPQQFLNYGSGYTDNSILMPFVIKDDAWIIVDDNATNDALWGVDNT